MKFIILLYIFCSAALFAEEIVIGEIDFLRGKVFKSIDGRHFSKESMQQKEKIYEHDVLKTASATYVKIKIIDMTTLTLGPNSVLDFSKFSLNKKSRGTVYHLMQGRLRALFKGQDRAGKTKVTTPTVSMAIRGTEILVSEFKKERVSKVVVIEGELEVTSLISQNVEYLTKGMKFVSMTNIDGKRFKEGVFKLPGQRQQELVAHSAPVAKMKSQILMKKTSSAGADLVLSESKPMDEITDKYFSDDGSGELIGTKWQTRPE